MKKPIFVLLALLFGASLYFNAPDKQGQISKDEPVILGEVTDKSLIPESTLSQSKNINKHQNLKSENKIVETSDNTGKKQADSKKSNILNKQQNSFVMLDAKSLQLEFNTEDEDIAWKAKEEDFYRVFYSEWLSTYPETNTEIEIECKSQHCKLRLSSIVSGPESFKALASFIKYLAKSGRPFNLLKFKPTDDFAEIMTKRVKE